MDEPAIVMDFYALACHVMYMDKTPRRPLSHATLNPKRLGRDASPHPKREMSHGKAKRPAEPGLSHHAPSQGLRIILNDSVQNALDHFSACFGVRIAYFDTNLQEIKVGQHKPVCTFCRLIRGASGGKKRCIELDRRKLREAAERRMLVSYACHGGLTEVIYPVFLNRVLVGYIMAGQFRTTSALPDNIRRDVRGNGSTAKTMIRAFDKVPFIKPVILPSMLGLFSMLVKSITHEGVTAIQGDLIIERILQRIRSMPDSPPTLEEAARLAGRSKSYVSHVFKTKLGRSFKSMVISIRLDKAEEELASSPGLTVKEVAARFGFSDEFYFSRIFRKYRGVPPSHLLQKHPSQPSLQSPPSALLKAAAPRL